MPIGAEADPAEAVLEIEHVEDQAEQQDAGQRRRDRADAAGQQRAADDDSGDREQFPADALGRLARAELRGQDDAGQTREHARLHIGPEHHPVDRQAHEARRLLVAADRQHIAAEAREVEHDRAIDIGDRRDPGRRRKAQKIALPEPGEIGVVGDRDGLVVRKQQPGAARHQHAGERGDERQDLHPRDHEAVDQRRREAGRRGRRAGLEQPVGREDAPTTTLAQAAVVPTERSMPPVMMTKHMPRLVSANMEL